MNKLNSLFDELNYYLYIYIKNESKKTPTLNHNIKQIVAKNSNVITFNYTDLIERYSKNVYYIHGSIKENFIILGYKERNQEPHDIGFESTLYKKRNLRELLHFKRFLEQKNITKYQIHYELEKFKKQIYRMESGRGGYTFMYTESTSKTIPLPSDFALKTKYRCYINNPTFLSANRFTKYISLTKLSKEMLLKTRNERLRYLSPLTNEYGEKNNFRFSPINCDVSFEDVEEIVILGHSLKSDIEIFKDIFQLTVNLKNIIIFTYENDNISEKIELIRKFSSINIELRLYK